MRNVSITSTCLEEHQVIGVSVSLRQLHKQVRLSRYKREKAAEELPQPQVSVETTAKPFSGTNKFPRMSEECPKNLFL